MTIYFRQRRIGEAIRRYQPIALADGMHAVRDTESGQLIESYADAELARTKCRMLAAADIEALYMPPEPTAVARVATIIGEQSDPAWAAQLIYEYFSGAKA